MHIPTWGSQGSDSGEAKAKEWAVAWFLEMGHEKL